MMLYVNFNASALGAQRNVSNIGDMYAKTQQRLSSGFRINNASDDAAGLQISERLRSTLRGNLKAQDNTQDGINVLNITDGALGQITENLQRMRELTVQAANDTLGSNQRTAIMDELLQLQQDITRISDSTSFNGVSLLNGTQTNFYIQLGPGSTATNDVINLATAAGTNPFGDVDAAALSVASANLTVGTNASSLTTSGLLDTAITTVNQRRSFIGALTNRLQGALNNLQINYENVGSSEARIRNVDVSRESTQLTQYQILQQAGLSMLSQANQTPQAALSLLRNGG
ncbi:MAG: flagellin [Vampirovibrionales bacterium]